MEYYVKLFELFARTAGLKINRNNYKTVYTSHKKEFIDWLETYKLVTYEYRGYLESYFGLDLDNSRVAELDKGNLDSVVRDEAYMITPYGYTFTDTYHYNSKLIVNDDGLKIDYGDVIESAEQINMFLVQNPYLNTDVISKLKKLYELRNKSIVLGMYGKVTDKDIKKKIRILKQFKNNVDPQNEIFDYDYNTREDNYFCAITKK